MTRPAGPVLPRRAGNPQGGNLGGGDTGRVSTDLPAPDLTGAAWTGSPAQRVARAREVADHLSSVLATIERGEVEATHLEVAHLEGAVLALRTVASRRGAPARPGPCEADLPHPDLALLGMPPTLGANLPQASYPAPSRHRTTTINPMRANTCWSSTTSRPGTTPPTSS